MYLMDVCLTDVRLVGVHFMRASHGCASHGRGPNR
jgi:hypothetical protein